MRIESENPQTSTRPSIVDTLYRRGLAAEVAERKRLEHQGRGEYAYSGITDGVQRNLNIDRATVLGTLTLAQINSLTPAAQNILRNAPVALDAPKGESYFQGGTVHLYPGSLYTQVAFHEAQHVLGSAYGSGSAYPKGFSITQDQMQQAQSAYNTSWPVVQKAFGQNFLSGLKRLTQYIGIGGGGSPQEAYATFAQAGAYRIDPSLRQFYPQFVPAAFNPPPLQPVSLDYLATRQWSYGRGR